MGHTAPLTSKRCILYIYSTNISTEYFKHALYSPFFFLSSKCSLFHNANLFGSCIHILYTECAKIKKKNNSGAKRLMEKVGRLVTGLCPDRSGVRFLTLAGDVSLHLIVQIRGPPSPLFSLVTGDVFPREKIDLGVKLTT